MSKYTGRTGFLIHGWMPMEIEILGSFSPLTFLDQFDLRELGGLERWFFLTDQIRPNHFAVIAEIAGETTPVQWRLALDQLQSRHPLLNVCIRVVDGSNMTFHKGDAAPIPLSVKPLVSARQSHRAAECELREPFSPGLAPLLRASLLQGDGRCQILLCAHHTVADGMSLAFLVRDLLMVLAAQELRPLPMPESQDILFAPLADPPAPTEDEAVSNAWIEPIDPGYPKVSSFCLDRKWTSDLERVARQQDTTVHAAVTAAVVLAGRMKFPKWKTSVVRVNSPISLRKVLNVGDDCALRISIGTITLDTTLDIEFWELARTAKQQLLPSQTIPCIASALAWFERTTANGAGAGAVWQQSAQSGFELAVTNLGKLPFDSRIGDLTIEAFWGPIINNGCADEQTVSAATVNGNLCLTQTSLQPIEGLLEKAADLLMRACQTRALP